MSYQVNKSDASYEVKEKDTGNILHTTSDFKEAKKVCRTLNLGSGFQGFTPDFFLYKYVIK